MPEPKIINPPTAITPDQLTGDRDRAKEVLGEIQAVLRKYGCILQFPAIVAPNSKPTILLARVTDPALNSARAIAGIYIVTPYWIDAYTVDENGQRRPLKDNRI